jgi:transglutaminase-like putative cysteine protease
MGRLAIEGSDTELASFLSRRAVAELPSSAPFIWNALALCAFVRNLIRYQTEDPETFTGLEALVWLGAGDCDDVSIALAALLLRCGWPVRWAVGMVGGRPSHVWVQTREPGPGRGPWVDLDCSTWRVRPGESPMILGELDTVEVFDLRGQRGSI